MVNMMENPVHIAPMQSTENEDIKKRSGSILSKADRNEIERKRRRQMKQLYSRLGSLISSQTSEGKLPLPALLDRATACIKQLRENIEELNRRKIQLKGAEISNENEGIGSVIPVLQVRDLGSTLEVTLVTGLNNKLIVHQVFSILQEQGAEVVSASYSTMGNRIFYTIYSQAILSRIGIDTSRVHEKLKKLGL